LVLLNNMSHWWLGAFVDRIGKTGPEGLWQVTGLALEACRDVESR